MLCSSSDYFRVQITEEVMMVDSVNHIEALGPDVSNRPEADSITSTTLQG